MNLLLTVTARVGVPYHRQQAQRERTQQVRHQHATGGVHAAQRARAATQKDKKRGRYTVQNASYPLPDTRAVLHHRAPALSSRISLQSALQQRTNAH